MQIYQVDEDGSLFISPVIGDWGALSALGIDVIFDLEGGLDAGVPTGPDQVLYLYFPIYDEELPNLKKLHGIAALGAELIRGGHRVLTHCSMGFNRSALVAGLILHKLGLPGVQVVAQIRARRQGALFNEIFAAYLESLV